MALKGRYFDPESYGIRMMFLCFLYILDIIGNVFLQFIDWGSQNTYTQYSIGKILPTPTIMNTGLVVYISNFKVRLQFGIQIVMLVVSLSFFWRTFLFKYGFVGMLFRNFKFSFILMVIYPVFFTVERIFRYFFLNNSNLIDFNELTIYESNAYLGIYIVKFIIGFTYYIVMINSTYELGKAKYYKSEYWFTAEIN